MSRSDRRDHCVGSGSNPSFLQDFQNVFFFFLLFVCLSLGSKMLIIFFLCLPRQPLAYKER